MGSSGPKIQVGTKRGRLTGRVFVERLFPDTPGLLYDKPFHVDLS